MHGCGKMDRMRRFVIRTTLAIGVSLLALCGVVTGTSFACTNAQTCSTHYNVNEAFFGDGGSLDGTCSTSYCAKQSAGELTVGNTSSTNYQAQAGFNTDRTPSLTLVVNDSQCSFYNSGVNLGYLSTSSATTGNANFSVKSYLAGSYTVTTVGPPPKSNAPTPHTFTTLTSGGTSVPGTEQFGINLVANTSPSVGASPSQLPSSSFGFGQAASGYGTPNTFKYNDGDTIARSTKSSGTTCYAISYLFNISGVTPNGVYTFNQSIVATSTF